VDRVGGTNLGWRPNLALQNFGFGTGPDDVKIQAIGNQGI